MRRSKKSLTILLALIFSVVLSACNVIDYWNAKKSMQNGDYETAISIFDTLQTEQYKDSGEKLKESRFMLAKQYMDESNYEMAIKLFSAVQGYKNSEELIKQCNFAITKNKYESAQDKMSKGSFQEALEIFEDLGSYEDSSKLAMYCKASLLGESEEYGEAVDSFRFLGDFKDSAYLCAYYSACNLEIQAAEDPALYMDAYEIFSGISLFRDSKQRGENCLSSMYNAAIEIGNLGNYPDAIILFKALGDYEESKNQIIYFQACSIKANAENDPQIYESAAEKFDTIAGFRDSGEKSLECRQALYDLASQLITQEKADYEDFGTARKWFLCLGKYSDSEKQAKECLYLTGKKQLDEIRLTEAVKTFSEIPGYKDSDELSEKADIVNNIDIKVSYVVLDSFSNPVIEYPSNLVYPADQEKGQKIRQCITVTNRNTKSVDGMLEEYFDGDDGSYYWMIEDQGNGITSNWVFTMTEKPEYTENREYRYEIWFDGLKALNGSYKIKSGNSPEKQKDLELAKDLLISTEIAIYDTAENKVINNYCPTAILDNLLDNQMYIPRIVINNTVTDEKIYSLSCLYENGSVGYWSETTLEGQDRTAYIDDGDGLSAGMTSITYFVNSVPVYEAAFTVYQNEEEYAEMTRDTVHAGDIVRFGVYEQDNDLSDSMEGIEWIVLKTGYDKTLLLSKYALDCRVFDINNEKTTWENCSLRKWLNEDFLEAAFSEKESADILLETVPEIKFYDRSDPGNSTKDRIFLLDISEVININVNAESFYWKCSPTKYAKEQGTRTSTVDSDEICRWWLRVPGIVPDYIALVNLKGEIDYSGVIPNNVTIGVRPAMWVNTAAIEGK